MVRRLVLIFSLLASPAFADLTISQGKLWFNGVKQEMVWGRSCFKLANIVSYHYAGQGGGFYSLGAAREWVDFNQQLGFDGCRVLLETAGWQQCETGDLANDGKPDNCMWGSEPVDKGFWNVEALKTGERPTDVHSRGKKIMRWFFETSQETGFMFELVIVATLKHTDGVTVQTQGHVVRQVMSEAHDLQQEFPQALILMNAINEWDAHSEWEMDGVDGVNMLATRNDRCKNDEGQVVVALDCPDGYEPEQWAGGPFIVDGGGSNRIAYEVGPEPGRFRGAFVHPVRDDSWHQWPDATERQWMMADARGMPWGATESMYYVEPEDFERAKTWYRMAGDSAAGWTTDWEKYEAFLSHIGLSWQPRVNASTGATSVGIAYHVIHDEKGVECDPAWPRELTRVDKWAMAHLSGAEPPPPPEKKLYFDAIIDSCYWFILGRDADENGMAAYNDWMRTCVPDRGLIACRDELQLALFNSDEYKRRFYR